MAFLTIRVILKWSSLAFVGLATAGTSIAAEQYVSATGNDTTGNGSISAPYRTIQFVLDNAAASGDTRTFG
jgi:hypothetical protein